MVMVARPVDKHTADWCSRHKEDCRYLKRLPGTGGYFCDYLDMTDELRGCTAGKGCTKYEKGSPEERAARGWKDDFWDW